MRISLTLLGLFFATQIFAADPISGTLQALSQKSYALKEAFDMYRRQYRSADLLIQGMVDKAGTAEENYYSSYAKEIFTGNKANQNGQQNSQDPRYRNQQQQGDPRYGNQQQQGQFGQQNSQYGQQGQQGNRTDQRFQGDGFGRENSNFQNYNPNYSNLDPRQPGRTSSLNPNVWLTNLNDAAGTLAYNWDNRDQQNNNQQQNNQRYNQYQQQQQQQQQQQTSGQIPTSQFVKVDDAYRNAVVMIYTYIEAARAIYLFNEKDEMPESDLEKFYVDTKDLHRKTQEIMSIMNTIRSSDAFQFMRSKNSFVQQESGRKSWEQLYGKYFHFGKNSRPLKIKHAEGRQGIVRYYLPFVKVDPSVFASLNLDDKDTNDRLVLLKQLIDKEKNKKNKKELMALYNDIRGGSTDEATPNPGADFKAEDPFAEDSKDSSTSTKEDDDNVMEDMEAEGEKDGAEVEKVESEGAKDPYPIKEEKKEQKEEALPLPPQDGQKSLLKK